MVNGDENIISLENAYKSKPYDIKIIFQLIEAYENKGEWEKVIKFLVRLAELEEDSVQRSKYYYTIAGIFHFDLEDLDSAIDYYEKTIENNALFFAAFHNIVKIREKTNKLRKLERNYRSMIKRVTLNYSDKVDELYQLWSGLAFLYKEKLKNYEKALSSFEMLLKLNPDDHNSRLEIADIYDKWDGGDKEKALDILMGILAVDPFNVNNLTKLFKMHWSNQHYDNAWCLAALIKGLGLENDEAERFYFQHAPKKLKKFSPGIIDSLWSTFILSKPQDYYLGQLFGLLADVVPFIKNETKKSLGLNGIEPEYKHEDSPLFDKIFYYILETYGFQFPELYLLPEKEEWLSFRTPIEKNNISKVITVGYNLLSGFNEKELNFIIAREMMYLLPGYLIIKLIPSRSELLTLVSGAVKLASPHIDFGENEILVNKTANRLYSLFPPEVIEQMSMIIKELTIDNKMPDVDGFIERTKISSHRIAFILSQDIVTSLKMIEQEPIQKGGYSVEQLKKFLIRFAASKEYFLLREQANISVE